MVVIVQVVAFFLTDFSRLSLFILSILVGLLGMIITFVQYAKKKNQKDFEGELIKTTVKTKSRGDASQGNNEKYYLHTLHFKDSQGKFHNYSIESRSKETTPNTWMGYLKVGDRVRFHAKQDYFEKYDKSNDIHIPCAKCQKYFETLKDNCPHCGAVTIKP